MTSVRSSFMCLVFQIRQEHCTLNIAAICNNDATMMMTAVCMIMMKIMSMIMMMTICRHRVLPLHALWRTFCPEVWQHLSSKLGKHWSDHEDDDDGDDDDDDDDEKVKINFCKSIKKCM